MSIMDHGLNYLNIQNYNIEIFMDNVNSEIRKAIGIGNSEIGMNMES